MTAEEAMTIEEAATTEEAMIPKGKTASINQGRDRADAVKAIIPTVRPTAAVNRI